MMKLTEYFSDAKYQHLDAQAKSRIFARVEKKQRGRNFSAIFGGAMVRRFVRSSAGVVAIVAVIFGGFFFEFFGQDSALEQLTAVRANPIADVVNFRGPVFVEDFGTGALENIRVGDVVTLGASGALELAVRGGVAVEIRGPAKFAIERDELDPQDFVLFVFEGRFFDVSAPEKLAKNESLAIDFANLRVVPDGSEPFHFVYLREESGRSVVQNKRGKVSVARGETVAVEVPVEHSAVVDAEKSEISLLENRVEVLVATEDSLDSGNVEDDFDQILASVLSGISTSAVESADASSFAVGSEISQKKVLSPEALAQLATKLHPQFLRSLAADLEEIATSGSAADRGFAQEKIAAAVRDVAAIFWPERRVASFGQDSVAQISAIQAAVEEEFLLPAVYRERIAILVEEISNFVAMGEQDAE